MCYSKIIIQTLHTGTLGVFTCMDSMVGT
uniref:Uncharacterized protein n=1 Tax=Anguilla anguilla TaxID=7936 RepID=A0A0E9PLD5_ANGAN